MWQVNLSHSSVHVPTDVFDGEEAVINAIDWSRKLEDTFQDNYKRDPGLSWQYFGSSTGFLRQVGSDLIKLELNDLASVSCHDLASSKGRPRYV